MMMKRLLAAVVVFILLMSSCLGVLAEDRFRILLWHGDEELNKVAITVDDCYNMLLFEQVLEIVEENQVPVTFFLVGSAIKETNQPLYERALADGCEFGNHTFSHPQLDGQENYYIMNQLRLTQEALDRVLGYHYPMQVMRPPFGRYQAQNGKLIIDPVTKAGYRHIVLWNVSNTNPKLALQQTSNGSILLYHTNPADVNCLRELIPQLIERGFELCTVSELLEMDPVATSTDLPAEGAAN